MAITYVELLQKLKQYDEFTLLDLLNISSEEIVERWKEEIDERYEELVTELGESEEESFGSEEED